jgi:membrane-associated protein
MFDSESLIRYGGLFLLFLSVFCQTGLFFCFFIPSGGLLFTAGVFVATGDLHENVFTVCSLLIVASVLGNITGYWFGWKAGPMMYRRKESRFFKRKHLETAEGFYKKYGNVALAAGLFFPIIRTFSPIVAGVIRLDFRRVLLFTFLGSVLWITCFVWGRLPGRHHAFFEAIFEIHCHRYYRGRNDPGHSWDHKAS